MKTAVLMFRPATDSKVEVIYQLGLQASITQAYKEFPGWIVLDSVILAS